MATKGVSLEALKAVENAGNYFVCTLGQAAEMNLRRPHTFSTINQFLDQQNDQIPNAPAVGFPVPSQNSGQGQDWDHEILSFADLYRGSIMFADLLKKDAQGSGVNGEGHIGHTTVALLCPSSPLFLFAWLGLMRAGFAVLLIAPQCQPPAIAHLCRICNVSVLFHDEIYTQLARDTAAEVDESTNLTASLLPFTYSTEDLYNFVRAEQTNDIDLEPLRSISEHDIAYLHHTSGTSTGLPKPIAQSHRAAVGVLPCFPDGASKATFTTTPLYHGGVADCFRAWTSGALIWLFPGKEVPITAINVLKSLRCAEKATIEDDDPPVKYFSSVPYVLQMVADDSKGLNVLTQMEIVGVGGAALPQTAGDTLVDRGIKLVSRFGSAECGFLMSSHREYVKDREWQFLRSTHGCEALCFEEQDDGLAELVILPGWPHMAKTNRDDGSLATADLFEAHASIPKAWKYNSRADSQLTLITGKKFDPAPLESAIATSEFLNDILIFGNSQQYPGALLFRSKMASNLTSLELIEKVWPIIDKLNEESQGHTRLSKSMLIAMPVGAPDLEKSSKGTILRGQAEKTFKQQIADSYNKSSLIANEDDRTKEMIVAEESIPSFVLQTINQVVKKEDFISEDTDLFSQGVDSVACMQIRAILQKRIMPARLKELPLNVVYDCGTANRLSEFLINVRSGRASTSEDEVELMQDLVKQYGTFLQEKIYNSPSNIARQSKDSLSQVDVVVLTGATGALGAHILDQLRSNTSISTIICLIRAANDEAAFSRVSKSLVFRGKAPLDPLDTKVVCKIAKLGTPTLGLSAEDLTTLQERATIIVHAAWAVNFSMRLRSFVKDHIAGIRNLLDLALSSRRSQTPRFLFCSSTASVLGSVIQSPIIENISHEPTTASSLGYSRSKWVAEAICEQAHLHSRLQGRVSVLRIGQLCGDTEKGVWNVTEAWPLMLSTVSATKSLPALEQEKLSWLPVDVAARAVLQMGLTERETDQEEEMPVYHLVNGNTTPSWMQMLQWMKALRKEPFDVLPPKEWVKRLELLNKENADHPAKKLLGLWKRAYYGGGDDNGAAKDGPAKDDVRFGMERTRKAVPEMQTIAPIDREHFRKMWQWIEQEMVQENLPKRSVGEVSVTA